MNAQKRVCTLGVHVHIHVMCIYRRQQYCTHGIWNANIFYKKSNKMLYPYREGTVHYSCYMRFGATLMCGTISVYVTLVVLFVFIKATVMVMVRSIWVTVKQTVCKTPFHFLDFFLIYFIYKSCSIRVELNYTRSIQMYLMKV